jgi:hypothetical protein
MRVVRDLVTECFPPIRETPIMELVASVYATRKPMANGQIIRSPVFREYVVRESVS